MSLAEYKEPCRKKSTAGLIRMPFSKCPSRAKANKPTMLQDGIEKVLKGETTLDELARVVPYEQVLEYGRKIDMGLVKSL